MRRNLWEFFLWRDLISAVLEGIHNINKLFWILKEFEVGIHHCLYPLLFGLKFSDDVFLLFWNLFPERSFIDLNSFFKHINRLSPKVYINFVPTQELELIFPLLVIPQFFLERIPQSNTILGSQIVRL